MRVKITYTVELEEVESEVSEIMSRAADNLDFAYQEVIKIQTELDSKEEGLDAKILRIDELRKKMAQADQILEDCHMILIGLRSAKKQIQEQENEVQVG